MLKHEILKTIQTIRDRPNKDLIPFEMRGELNVRAWKDGQLFYHDGGDNTITIWAKHNMIHLLTGDAFSDLGVVMQSLVSSSNDDHNISPEKNNDGMLISQNQYWWLGDDWEGQWSINSGQFVGDYYYPYFPTKMLFGTGKEYANWAHVLSSATAEEIDFLDDTWSTSGSFDNNISLEDNYYSGTVLNGTIYQKYGNYSIAKCRTVNDYLSGKIEGSPDQNEYGVVGAIKNGTLTEAIDETKLVTGTTDILTADYRGIGKPCFIYCKRDIKWNDSSAEVFLSNEGLGYENKITFTVTMPDQTSASNSLGFFYPYNGYDLKEVGLFSDNLLGIGGVNDGNFPYRNMMAGTMLAKRYIAPLRKEANVAVSAQWTLYL